MAEGSASQKEANDKSSSDWDWPTTTWSTDATSRISTSSHSRTDTSKVSTRVSMSSSKFKPLPDPFKQPTRSNSFAASGNRGTKILQENDKLTIQQLEKIIESLQKKLEVEECLDKQFTLKGRIKEFQEKYEKLKAEEVTLQLAEASKDINHERQRVEKLEEQVNENQKELERIKKEKVAEVSELEERVRQYKKKLEKQELATDAAQSEVEFLKKEEDRLKKENKELKKESKNTAIQSAQRIEEQEKEFMETERREIKALTRDIEQSRAELKKQEDNFKSQLKEKEDEILRVSNQCNEHKAKFEACSSEIEQLQKNYDADMEKLKVAIKKQYNKESTLRSELKELHDTITKIETDKRLKSKELTKEINELKEELDEIGKKLKEKEELVDKQKEKIEALQAIHKKLTEDGINKESELQDTRDQLQKVKDKLAKNMEEKDEVIASLQQAVEVRSETVSQMKKTLDQQMTEANEQLEAKQKQIDELVEKLQVKEAQSVIYKQDFETERNDRQKLHQSLTDWQAHCEYLKQKLAEEEEKFTTAQRQHHELQQQYAGDKEQLINEHSKLIASMTDEGEKTKGELMKAKEEISSLTKEKKRLEKQIEELKQGETDRVKEMEEEIQTLTAQVNAYSREVDRQKGLVIQLKEKLKSEVNSKTTEHKKVDDEKQQLVSKTSELERNLTAELKSKGQQQQQISELNKRVTNEVKAKQQLAQQFDTLSANYQKLLTTYHEERAMVTKLEDKIEKMKEANVVLRTKFQQQAITTDPRGIREPQHPHYPLPSNIAVRPNSTPAPVPEPVVQSDGDGMLVVSKTEGVTPSHHTDSDSVPEDSPAFISKEEMTRMFKSHDQQGSSDWNQSPQQVQDSSLAAQKMRPTEESLVAEQHRQELARKADDALLEVDRMRKRAEHQQTNNDSNTQDQSRPKGQLTREEAEKGRRPNTIQDTATKEKPVHPQPKANDNQGKQQPTNDDSDSDIEENKLIDNIDEEIQQMAEDVRKGSRGPTTAEVMFDDDDSSLPYDPNLVCPKCGKQYRVGEIQKLRRHINEFCTGIR